MLSAGIPYVGGPHGWKNVAQDAVQVFGLVIDDQIGKLIQYRGNEAPMSSGRLSEQFSEHDRGHCERERRQGSARMLMRCGGSGLRFRSDLVIAKRPHEHFLIHRLPGIVEQRRDAWRPADLRALPRNNNQRGGRLLIA